MATTALSAPSPNRPRPFRRQYWVLVPLLAIAAYALTVSLGFLSDDFVILNSAWHSPVTVQSFLPDPGWFFYRPVGGVLTWSLGWQLWGANPLPYHLLGLLIHAGAALALALWLAEATGRKALGWLAGALFAVFPLHMEAVGWLAAQWDAWAVLFGITGLGLFTAWWRRGAPGHYVGAVSAYALGLFSKESLFTFLPLFALSAWLVTPSLDRRARLRLGAALLPFAAVLALNLGLRYVTWGNLGGYSETDITSYDRFFWDRLSDHIRLLLAPLNPAVWGAGLVQVVGALTSLALLAGLVAVGRQQWRVLGMAAIWLGLALLPTVGLRIDPNNLEGNRYLYLAAAGYCIGLAALGHALLAAHRAGFLLVLGGLLAVSSATTWVQLHPWQVASAQASELTQELLRLIPLQPPPAIQDWNIQSTPDNYQGAFVFRLGLGPARGLAGGDEIVPHPVDNLGLAPLPASERGAFALRFDYDAATQRYHVGYGLGITAGSPPPDGAGGTQLQVWDFSRCDPAVLGRWQVEQAQTTCVPGAGLRLQPTGSDPNLVGLGLTADPAAHGAYYVRLRAALLYPAAPRAGQLVQWFWQGPQTGFTGEQVRTIPSRPDSAAHVYWTFLSPTDSVGGVTGLRFDPTNDTTPVEIGWIAVDLVR